RCVSCGRDDALVALDVAAGGLVCRDCGGWLGLSPVEVGELRALVTAPLRAALGCPPADRGRHWRLLGLYAAYHASELLSLASLNHRPGEVTPQRGLPVGDV